MEEGPGSTSEYSWTDADVRFFGTLRVNKKKRFLVIHNDSLSIFKSEKEYDKGKEPVAEYNVMALKVKAHPSKKNTFEVFSLTDRFNCQASNQDQMELWIQALQQASFLAFALEVTDASNRVAGAHPDHVSGGVVKAALRKSKRNRVCAECGQHDPDWASVSLGVCVCVQCSSVHRSLGTHVSRIRSLIMDDWDVDTLKLMKAIGNARANYIWENDTDVKGYTKPTAADPVDVKEEWIRAKYVDKVFLPTLSGKEKKQGNIDKALYKAVSGGKMNDVLFLVAVGANVNYVNKKDGRTPLHKAALVGDSNVVLFLCLHGADLRAGDKEGKTPRDLAIKAGHAECVAMLERRAANAGGMLTSHSSDSASGSASGSGTKSGSGSESGSGSRSGSSAKSKSGSGSESPAGSSSEAGSSGGDSSSSDQGRRKKAKSKSKSKSKGKGGSKGNTKSKSKSKGKGKGKGNGKGKGKGKGGGKASRKASKKSSKGGKIKGKGKGKKKRK